MVMRLVLRRQTTDEAVGMLVWRFPAVSPPQLVRDGDGCWSSSLEEQHLAGTRGGARIEQLHFSHVSTSVNDGSWRASTPRQHRRSQPAHHPLRVAHH
jgi:hypothetical protein